MPEIVENSSSVKRTPPNCARCKNHGVKNILSGHKRYCLYLDCKCSKCLSTVERQRAMAKNTAQRRAEKQHKKKLEEWQKRAQMAREMGQQIPPEPAELPSPILSPKVRTPSEYSSSERNLSPKSNYSLISSDILSVSSLNSRDKDEASTSDRVDLRSSLRSLQELLLQENFPLEISTLLYLILKDTPEPKKAYSRIVEAQTELNSGYTRDEIPSYIFPYIGSSRFFPSTFLSSHAALSLSPSYYHQQYKQYSLANASLPLPPSCPYPPYFSAAIQTLRSPATADFLSCAAPLPFVEDKKHRLSFDAIQLTKDTRPSNLCIRETSSSFSPLENKFSVSEAK